MRTRSMQVEEEEEEEEEEEDEQEEVHAEQLPQSFWRTALNYLTLTWLTPAALHSR